MPTAIVHRYTFPMREAMAALLGDEQIDADSYEIRVVDNCLILDIVNPVTASAPLRPMPKTDEEAREMVEDAIASLAAEGSITIEQNTTVDLDADPEEDAGLPPREEQDPPFDVDPPKETIPEPKKEEKLKGGPLAQRAGIICGEKAFQIWMDEKDANGAAAALRQVCGIESRAELDHNPQAAREFRKLDAEYQAWCRE